MQRLFSTTGLILLLLAGGGCARFVDYGQGFTQTGHTRDYSRPKPPRNHVVAHHVVQPGETLYSIAWRYGHDYREVARWNGIRAPYTIFRGQKLRVRPPVGKTAAANAKPRTKPATAPRNKSRPVAPRPGHRTQSARITWHWPARGKVISRFAAGDPGRQGIDIAGRSGQPVYAAAAGEVVYSGKGLRGYGNLVIIKHSETYFSAYAHNRKVHIKEKDRVKSGQHIADMGDSGSDRVMLHFEIRRNGKPVNPLKYLPKKGS
jgi:lipoprotein NlpD